MKTSINTWYFFAGGIGAAILAAAALALGPLDPPPGPVAETTPSLADLETKLDQVLSQQGAENPYQAPWQVFRVPAVGPFASNTSGTLVAEGRVYVHSVTSYRSILAIFDGQGSIDQGTHESLTPNWIARLSHYFTSSGSGNGQINTITIPVEQVVENGLYVAWAVETPHSYIYILYKSIPE